MPPDPMPVLDYPDPPWRLKGEGLMVFAFPQIESLSYPLRSELKWEAVFRRRTLAGYYIAEYSTLLVVDDSALWHEWGNIVGLAKHGMLGGFILDPMAVDNPTALKGGEEVWGLNKMTGKIEYKSGRKEGWAQLSVDSSLTELSWREMGPSFPWTSNSVFLTRIGGVWHTYKVVLKGRHRICRVTVVQQSVTDFTSLQTGKYWGIRFTHAVIEISAPAPVI